MVSVCLSVVLLLLLLLFFVVAVAAAAVAVVIVVDKSYVLFPLFIRRSICVNQ